MVVFFSAVSDSFCLFHAVAFSVLKKLFVVICCYLFWVFCIYVP